MSGAAAQTRCAICVDPSCVPGSTPCHCANCTRAADCHRVLRPTVRITRQCTQSCSHCCFSCSPQRTERMSLAGARLVAEFLTNNAIGELQLMGGEVFCHPDWQAIVTLLAAGRQARLVTNGDWAAAPEAAATADFLATQPGLRVGLSRDRWHSNRHVDRAAELLGRAGVHWRMASAEETDPDGLVPAGRAAFEYGLYASFGCWCDRPDHRYALLIDEALDISKCPFGAWQYATVADYASGGFAARFKEFTTTFHGVWRGNCRACQRLWGQVQARERAAANPNRTAAH